MRTFPFQPKRNPRLRPRGGVGHWLVVPAILALLVCAAPRSATAQDVELLGQIHGTRPPDGYYRQRARDPEAFRFRHEGRERMNALRSGMRSGLGASASSVRSRAIGPREDPVVGVFRFPLVLGGFSDGPQEFAFLRDQVQTEFFDGPNSYYQTLTEYYEEISGGLLQLEGVAFDWEDTGMDRASVTLGESGLSSSFDKGVGAFIEAIVQELDDSGVDWSQFDESGDGFVDVLTVFHTDQGAECDGAANRIWSHRWSLSSATQGRLPNGFPTSTPRPNGPGNIHINDYTIQPVLACDAESISEIGTFAHELGHGFGLPDLYRTSSGGFFAGAGNWDLMATGGWGCGGSTPERPCHMGAWTKAALGWLTVEEVPPETDEIITLEPVETGGRVLKLPGQDGSREYVLLENRQRIGSDQTLYEPGLLIWQVDEDVLDQKWPLNTINVDPNRMGVRLRQADGKAQLTTAGAGRGDPGDSFPGCIKPSPFDYNDPLVPCERNREFHAGKAPASISQLGGGLGVTLTDIESVGGAPHDLRFALNTGIARITLEAIQSGAVADIAGFDVDGTIYSSSPVFFLSAPFQSHQIIAPVGIPLDPGRRIAFEGWSDGAERSREFTTQFSDQTFQALYGGEEIRLRVTTNDPAGGIVPGSFSAEPGAKTPEGEDFWYPAGTAVSILAVPRTGFSFRDWSMVSTPLANPVSVNLGLPSEIRANFDVAYNLVPIPETLEIEATVPQEIRLQVIDGNEPVSWTIESGRLPEGLELDAVAGLITGAAVEVGEFELDVLARDDIGLEARMPVSLDVERPELGTDLLVSAFVAAQDLTTEPQRIYLDREGNADGRYDIGDFRAYLAANPGLPANAPAAQLSRTVIRMGELAVPASRGVPEDE